MKTLRPMFSTLAIALLALLANPAPVALAQYPKPGVVVPKGITITVTGTGRTAAEADKSAEKKLHMQQIRAAGMNIFWGPVVTHRTFTPGYWYFYPPVHTTTMTVKSN